MDSYMQSLVKLYDFSGVVYVVKNDSVCLKQAYGYADRETKTPNTYTTKFRIGSVTKQFTAAAIMLLEEEGKLSTTDKLSKYFPDFPKGDEVTLHLLLSHRSGIKDYTNAKDIYKKDTVFYTQTKMITLIKKLGYVFPPNKKCEYSNSNYYLLGCIIEKVSGMQYEQFLTERIFTPIGLNATGVDKNNVLLHDEAKGYENNNKKGFKPGKYIKLETAYSAGCLYSTIEDMYKWSRSLRVNNVISESSKEKMFTPYTFSNSIEHFGYGAIADSFTVHRKIWHSGGIYGFTSQFVIYPEDNITIIILSNSDCEIDNAQTSNVLSAILFGYKTNDKYKHIPIKKSKTDLMKYAETFVSQGKYNESYEVSIVLKGNKLYRRKMGVKDIELIPEGNDRFFYADNSQRYIQFNISKAGSLSVDFYIQDVLFDHWDRK
ncbi:hypothetical protein BH10BAC1_BH10BAC1_11790 [soil metagenome]